MPVSRTSVLISEPRILSLPPEIIIFPRTTSLENSRSLQEGIQEDLIELYLLSKNKVLIGSFNSTYSEVAWWLGGCNEKITIL